MRGGGWPQMGWPQMHFPHLFCFQSTIINNLTPCFTPIQVHILNSVYTGRCKDNWKMLDMLLFYERKSLTYCTLLYFSFVAKIQATKQQILKNFHFQLQCSFASKTQSVSMNIINIITNWIISLISIFFWLALHQPSLYTTCIWEV